MDAELEIFLGDIPVGVLTIGADDHCTFRLHRSYRERYPRPVLGQQFEDEPEKVHRSRIRLPPFFANLLPEGKLRRLIARDAGVEEVDDAFLLARLGEDLPGAVRVVPRGEIRPAADDRKEQAEDPGSRLRFSLAGIQLKFSMLHRDNRFMLPMQGRNGTWLVKLPNPGYERVPEVEYATMRWAGAAGIIVPEHELVPVTKLDGLPPVIAALPGNALAVRRFDRFEGRRVHQEDFAQVFGLYPKQKYDKYNYETIASVILRTAGHEAFHDFITRLVFVVLSGNADAHHKNWSLRYPDGHTAELSPAYDQVSTLLFIPNDELALNLARSKAYEAVSLASFQRMGRKLGLDPEDVARRARDAVRRIRDAWSTVRAEVPLTDEQRDTIERHWRRIPLVHEAG